jgi:hypothetical protein
VCRQIFDVPVREVLFAKADVKVGGLKPLVAILSIVLVERLSKASRIAVGHWSSNTSQMRRRSATGSEVGAVCVRARRKEETVARWMNCIVVVRKNLS